MGVNGEKIIIFWSQSLYALDYTYVVCGFKDNFSCKEFDRLLCNCSDKGSRENTTRKTTRLVCDVTLPATGVEKTDNLHIGLTETLHVPRFIVVFTSFDAFILPLEKSGEVEQRDVCTRVVVTYIICAESSEEL